MGQAARDGWSSAGPVSVEEESCVSRYLYTQASINQTDTENPAIVDAHYPGEYSKTRTTVRRAQLRVGVAMVMAIDGVGITIFSLSD
jgi:hypothetical protein